MSLLWVRPSQGEARYGPDERRVRDVVDTRLGLRDSVASLAAKLELDQRRCRRALERLVQEGVVQRRDFEDMEPLYCRFPGR